MKRCVFAGTFDPFTVGHADTVEKSLMIFDEVLISVAENLSKHCLFTSEERKKMIEEVYRNEKRVKVLIWDGAIVDLLERENTSFYVRGVRNTGDFEYERADFYASRDISQKMITIFLPSEQKHLHISSTLVKNCIAFGKNFSAYVPKEVSEYIERSKCIRRK